jgi:hypothetical protein
MPMYRLLGCEEKRCSRWVKQKASKGASRNREEMKLRGARTPLATRWADLSRADTLTKPAFTDTYTMRFLSIYRGVSLGK